MHVIESCLFPLNLQLPVNRAGGYSSSLVKLTVLDTTDNSFNIQEDWDYVFDSGSNSIISDIAMKELSSCTALVLLEAQELYN